MIMEIEFSCKNIKANFKQNTWHCQILLYKLNFIIELVLISHCWKNFHQILISVIYQVSFSLYLLLLKLLITTLFGGVYVQFYYIKCNIFLEKSKKKIEAILLYILTWSQRLSIIFISLSFIDFVYFSTLLNFNINCSSLYWSAIIFDRTFFHFHKHYNDGPVVLY